MTSIEQRLQSALGGADDVVESSDLAVRVELSIADDRRLRSQHRAVAAIVACIVGAVGGVVFATVGYPADPSTSRSEGLAMDWWILELITDALLVGIAFWLGPLIKRFGRSYAADVFRANPRTGKSFLALTDVAYYLIFVAYILFTARFEPEPAWDGLVSAQQLKQATARLGGILLIIGVLHGLNLLALPVVGRMLTLNRRLDESVGPDGGAERSR